MREFIDIDHMSNVSTRAMAKSSIEWIAKMGRNGRNIFHHAPTAIIVSGKQKGAFDPVVDCSAVIENMLLTAEAMDIGSCWIGLVRYFFEQPEEVKRLNLTRRISAVSWCMSGI